MSVVTPDLAVGINALTGTGLTVQVGDSLTLGGDIGLSQDRSSGEVLLVGRNGSALIDAGVTRFGVGAAQFALRLPGTNPRQYELYAQGNAQLSVTNPTGSGTLLSASGIATLYRNLGPATRAAYTATVGSGANAISVAVPELVSRVDVLTGTNLQVKVDNYLTLSGDLALGEDRDSGSVLVLGQNGTAKLEAGTTDVGVSNARMSLQFNRADPSKYALFATGDAQLAVDNPTGSGLVLSASGTASLFQNTTGLSVVGETLELGAGAHLVSVVTPDLAAGINALTGTGLTVQIGDALRVRGNVGLSQSRSSGEVIVLGTGGEAMLTAGTTDLGVTGAQFAVRVPGARPREYEVFARGEAALRIDGPTGGGPLLTASGTATLLQNLGSTSRAAQTLSVGAGTNIITVAVPELVERVDVLTGTDLVLTLQDGFTARGNLAAAQDRASGDMLVLGSNGSALLTAGTTSAGIANGRLALQMPGTNPRNYALYAEGDGVMSSTDAGTGVVGTGHFLVEQNRTGRVIVAETLTLGPPGAQVSVAVPAMQRDRNVIEAQGLVVDVAGYVEVRGDAALVLDAVTDETTVVVRQASALVKASAFSAGVTG
ncbi:MAG: hypothetical protein ACOYOQ_16485, partial [Microthrixaceae bacterium]